jgi:DNA-binding beta-propeller fold protein YncE
MEQKCLLLALSEMTLTNILYPQGLMFLLLVIHRTFSVSAQETAPEGIAFNTDGTKMFVVGDTGEAIFEYYLTPSLELGTGSFASSDIGKTVEANSGKFVLTNTDGRCAETTQPTSYAQVASGDWEMYGVIYNPVDGDLELSGVADPNLYFDITTAIYEQSFSVARQETTPKDVAFNTDGTKMFVIGYVKMLFTNTLYL